MASASPRASFNSSRLVRCLTDLDIADVGESKQSFADRLSQWLDLTDSIALSAVLKRGATGGQGASSEAASSGPIDIHGEFARVRAALMSSIGGEEALATGTGRARMPIPAPGASADNAADFSPFHRYYLARQRDMDGSIGPLRINVREALSARSPALRQLAALDAVMEEALRGRERSLLAAVPLLLAKRFERLRRDHQAALAETQTPDDPELWMRPGAWLATFCRDMQNVLLAELELRLQPVAGLIDALGEEVTQRQ